VDCYEGWKENGCYSGDSGMKAVLVGFVSLNPAEGSVKGRNGGWGCHYGVIKLMCIYA
jgi:hypothetical protein